MFFLVIVCSPSGPETCCVDKFESGLASNSQRSAASASQVLGIKGIYHHAWIMCIYYYYLCVCAVHMHMCRGVYACVYACMWSPDKYLDVLPQALSTLTFTFKVFLCRHVCMCREVYVCAQVHGQRLVADIILDHSVPYLWRQSLSDPELANSAGLVSQSP